MTYHAEIVYNHDRDDMDSGTFETFYQAIKAIVSWGLGMGVHTCRINNIPFTYRDGAVYDDRGEVVTEAVFAEKQSAEQNRIAAFHSNLKGSL
jgi:hypothetical protein